MRRRGHKMKFFKKIFKTPSQIAEEELRVSKREKPNQSKKSRKQEKDKRKKAPKKSGKDNTNLFRKVKNLFVSDSKKARKKKSASKKHNWFKDSGKNNKSKKRKTSKKNNRGFFKSFKEKFFSETNTITKKVEKTSEELMNKSSLKLWFSHKSTLRFILRAVLLLIIFTIEAFIIKLSVDFGKAEVDVAELLHLPQQIPTLILVSGLVFFLIGKERLFFMKEIPKLQFKKFITYFSMNVVGFLAFVWYNIHLAANSTSVAESPFNYLFFWYVLAVFMTLALIFAFFSIKTLRILYRDFKSPLIKSIMLGVAFILVYPLIYTLWSILSHIVGRLSYLILSLFESNVSLSIQNGIPLISLQNFKASIASACSGIEGIALFLLLFTVFVIYNRRSINWEKVLFIYIMGSIGVILVNVLRVSILFLIGENISASLAAGFFHTNLGWIIYAIYFILLETIIVEWIKR